MKRLMPLAICAFSACANLATAKDVKVLDIAYYPPVPCVSEPTTLARVTNAKAIDTPVDGNLRTLFDGDISGMFWHFAYWQVPNYPAVDKNFKGLNIDLTLAAPVPIASITPYFGGLNRPEQFVIKVSNDASFSNSTVFYTELKGLEGYSASNPAAAIVQSKTYVPAGGAITARFIRIEVLDYRVATTADTGSIDLSEVEVKSPSPTTCGAGTVDMNVIEQIEGLRTNQLSVAKTKHSQISATIANALTQGTRYLGKGAPYLNYTVVGNLERYELMPAAGYAGDVVVDNTAVGFGVRPDYRKILTDANICSYVDGQGVSEVWLSGYHNDTIVYAGKHMPRIVPQESDMSMGLTAGAAGLWNATSNDSVNRFQPVGGASFGDVSNASPSGQDDLPRCQKTYTLYNYTHSVGVGNSIHDHIHQLENLFQFGYLDVNKDGAFSSSSDIHNYELFWKNFVGKQYINPSSSSNNFDAAFSYLEPLAGTKLNWICGNAHFAPSASNEKHEYRYSLEFGVNYASTEFPNLDTSATSICNSWNQPTKATPELLDAKAWKGVIDTSTGLPFNEDAAFYIWWMQHIPAADPVVMDYKGTSYLLRNWWDAKADFDGFYSKSLSLLAEKSSSSSAPSSISSVSSSSVLSSSSRPSSSSVLSSSSRPSSSSVVSSSSQPSSSSVVSSSSIVSSSSSVAPNVANSCSYVISNQWGTGFTAAIRIKNNRTTAMSGWSVNWSYSDGSAVTGGWNAVITGSAPYAATNMGYNGIIQPGQTVEFGFQGTKPNNLSASIPVVTGTACN